MAAARPARVRAYARVWITALWRYRLWGITVAWRGQGRGRAGVYARTRAGGGWGSVAQRRLRRRRQRRRRRRARAHPQYPRRNREHGGVPEEVGARHEARRDVGPDRL